MREPPTKSVARSLNVPVYQPSSIRRPDTLELIEGLEPDCIVVVAYGKIIPKPILEVPPKGIINLHASLLPHYRGAAPIQWSIVRGEQITGVTTMLLDEGLDTGPILMQRKLPIEPRETAESLEQRLALFGSALVMDTLAAWERDELTPMPQDDSLATIAPLIRKEHARIDWRRPARELENLVRGFIPWPIAHAVFRDATIKIFEARHEARSPGRSAGEAGTSSRPGETLAIDDEGIVIGCGASSRLRVVELQAPGKKRLAAAAFARGQRVRDGELWD